MIAAPTEPIDDSSEENYGGNEENCAVIQQNDGTIHLNLARIQSDDGSQLLNLTRIQTIDGSHQMNCGNHFTLADMQNLNFHVTRLLDKSI